MYCAHMNLKVDLDMSNMSIELYVLANYYDFVTVLEAFSMFFFYLVLTKYCFCFNKIFVLRKQNDLI